MSEANDIAWLARAKTLELNKSFYIIFAVAGFVALTGIATILTTLFGDHMSTKLTSLAIVGVLGGFVMAGRATGKGDAFLIYTLIALAAISFIGTILAVVFAPHASVKITGIAITIGGAALLILSKVTGLKEDLFVALAAVLAVASGIASLGALIYMIVT